MATRLLTINIRKYLVNQPRRKRPARISRYIRYRIAQSTNIKSGNIKITQDLNSLVLKKYLFSMKPLKVSIEIDKDKAKVSHFEKAAKPVADAKPGQAKVEAKRPDEKQKAQAQTPEKKTDAKEAKA